MAVRVIVCGLGTIGYRIFGLLRQQNVLAVGMHPTPVEDEPDVVVGPLQAASTLVRAGIESAHTLVITTRDDAQNLEILMQARLLNPRIRVINRLFNHHLGERLDQTLPSHTSISVSALSAPIFAFAAFGNPAIGQLRLFGQTWPMFEIYIDANHPWRDRKLREIWDDRARMLIYYWSQNREMNLVRGLKNGRPLQVGDHLIVAIQPVVKSRRPFLRQAFWQVLLGLRQFKRHGSTTILGLLALLSTIGIATFTYVSYSLKGISIIDALYFSVGMITGAGGNELIAEHASNTIKVFTVVMMLVGAAIIGLCYALLNDWVLGARFRTMWEGVLIPRQDHYIVCGLGGIGIRVIQQLRQQGYEVVAIDQDAHNRFLSKARSLKVAVIQGDASLASTLESANIYRAAGLLAVTSQDMVNLDIALTAKELASKLSIIMRCGDPGRAELMNHTFDFEAVLSPGDLVAPAFAAAALGGQVLGSGRTAESLWIAVSVRIAEGHPFCGQRLQEVAIAVNLTPLYLERQSHTIHGWALLEAELQPEDILHLTIEAQNIEQLWQPLVEADPAKVSSREC
jgi:Trk K+ transport system NAD-binding subunit